LKEKLEFVLANFLKINAFVFLEIIFFIIRFQLSWKTKAIDGQVSKEQQTNMMNANCFASSSSIYIVCVVAL